MYDEWTVDAWRSELTKRLADAKFSDLLGDILELFFGTDDLVWRLVGRPNQYGLFVNGMQEKHFDRNGLLFIEPSRAVIQDRYLPILNKCGIGISIEDVDGLLTYIDPSAEYHTALEGFYVWRMSWIVHAIERIVLDLCLREVNYVAVDLEKEVSTLFEQNRGNWWVLTTMATKSYDYMFLEWDCFYNHGNYAFDRCYYKAALALYRRVPSIAGKTPREQHDFNLRCCLLNLYDNKPAYEEYFKAIGLKWMTPVCCDHLLSFRHFRRGEFNEAIQYCERHYNYTHWQGDKPMIFEFFFGYIHIDCHLQLGSKVMAMDVARHYWNDTNYDRTRLLDRLADSLVGMNMEDVAEYLSALIASEGEGRKSNREERARMNEIISMSVGYDEETARVLGE